MKPLPDPEGMVCANDEAAIAQGVRTVLEMLADDVRQGRIDLGWRMQIEDETRRPERPSRSPKSSAARISRTRDPSSNSDCRRPTIVIPAKAGTQGN